MASRDKTASGDGAPADVVSQESRVFRAMGGEVTPWSESEGAKESDAVGTG